VFGRPDRLRRGLSAGAGLALVLLPSLARAQSIYTWGGGGGTTTTVDYNLATNWSSPPAGAPPVAGGQSALFDAAGSNVVTVTSGPITPDLWAFSTNAQSYVISGSAVNFGQAGSGGGIVVNSNGGQTISIANDIGETVAGVQVQVLAQSTLVLSGINSYSGGTVIADGGTVQVTNDNSVGTGTVTLANGYFAAAGPVDVTIGNNFKTDNTLGGGFDANGGHLTIAGNIADGSGGAGSVTIFDSMGGGAVIFTGSNTYSGGTWIGFGGTLQLGSLARSGSLVGQVTNAGTFDIVNADTTGITSIGNDGSFSTVQTIFHNSTSASSIAITNIEGGQTIFLDTSSAGNATINNSGSFGFTTFADNSTAGNATIDNGRGFTGFQGQANAGTANITNHDQGVTSFQDGASAGSATIVNNNRGTTSFSNDATAGNATIITNRGGSTFFQNHATGGNAQFITNGTGSVDFSASTGTNGDGRIRAGSIAGSGSYVIGAGNTLVVGGNNLSTVVSGRITDGCGCGPGGPGALEKVGSGRLTLTGVNRYTGTTTVNGGLLEVDGSIVSSNLTTVNAGGALTGTGTVGNTTIVNGGIFMPGNGVPGSTMRVSGNLAFQSGALYLVTLDSTRSTMASVSGTASLAGSVGVAVVPGSTVMKQYRVLTASGGVSGGFDGVAITGGPAALVGSVSSDAHNAYLNLTLDFGAQPGLNENQRNVGTTLTNFFNANGGIPSAFAVLTPAGLTQASGEAATGTQQATFKAMNLFLGLISDPFVAGRDGGGSSSGGAQAYAATATSAVARDAFARLPAKAEARNDAIDSRWSVWGAAFGGGSDTDGNAALGSHAATLQTWGVVGGADVRLSPSTLVGFALSGGATSFGVSGLGGGRSDLFQAGLFARHTIGAGYLTGALAYGGQEVTTDRTVTIAGSDRLQARFNSNSISGRIEAGHRLATAWMGVTPYAGAQFTALRLPARAEQVLAGSGTFALNYAAKDVTWSRSELGLRTDTSYALGNANLTLRGRVGWAHDFNPDRTVAASFQALPGTFFIVSGAAQPRDLALTTASAEMAWRNGWSAAATFEGEFSPISRSYAGKGVVRYAW